MQTSVKPTDPKEALVRKILITPEDLYCLDICSCCSDTEFFYKMTSTARSWFVAYSNATLDAGEDSRFLTESMTYLAIGDFLGDLLKSARENFGNHTKESWAVVLHGLIYKHLAPDNPSVTSMYKTSLRHWFTDFTSRFEERVDGLWIGDHSAAYAMLDELFGHILWHHFNKKLGAILQTELNKRTAEPAI